MVKLRNYTVDSSETHRDILLEFSKWFGLMIANWKKENTWHESLPPSA